jgi:hypothetical protein
MTCYGCGEKGHGMGRCPIIADMIQKNIFAKDHTDRLVYKDGTPIRRLSDETYVQAYEREQRPSSHFIMVAEDSEDDSGLNSDETNYASNTQSYFPEDSDAEDVFAIYNVGWKSFAADRPEKKIAARQKMVMDGVYPPRLKDLAKGKENRPADPETGRPVRPGKKQAPKPTPPKEPVKKPKKSPEPIPVEVHKPRYDASKDNQIIEDKQIKSNSSRKQPQDELLDEAKAVDKRLPRKSAVSEHVNVLGVLDQVLNAKVKLAVGEIIGVSRELSSQLASAIKFKTSKTSEPVGFTTLGN